MTRVCLLGADDVELRYELVSHETASEALSTYELTEPYQNAVALDTVSLGAAVSVLNDLNWYLVRFAADALVLEPSVSEREWFSRNLAEAIREDRVAPADSDRFLKIYGVVTPDDESSEPPTAETAPASSPADQAAGSSISADGPTDGESPADTEDPSADPGGGRPRLVEPMYVTRTGRDLPEYDLRDVADTVVVRVTEAEFGP